MCSSFHNASSKLCMAMALVGKRICTSYVDPMGLRAFVASRLIALDKCPGGQLELVKSHDRSVGRSS